ncbi:MAG: [FeFe] hydrogenase H-cluster maturation GTPase HydF [Clostridiales bacterium]|nr:[FeFe] hydrogenase H-cluster maturation GTPase HydF [Clostridiales bacterium]
MSLNSTPSANRVHIGFFGRRNAGKSSVVNAVTGQDLAVVSEVRGTTTDPVYKSMELLPMGPVVIIDTPGFDDEGALGDLRVKKTKQVLNKTDVAVLIVDAVEGKQPCDEELIALFKEKEIPYIVAYNKADLLKDGAAGAVKKDLNGGAAPADKKNHAGKIYDDKNFSVNEQTVETDTEDGREAGSVKSEGAEQKIYVSALYKENIYELKEMIGRSVVMEDERLRIVGDLISPGDFVVLVVPIDSAAPKGRLILPQQQTIRDVLEANATALVVKENGLAETLKNAGKKPSLVITDSQAFEQVADTVPEDILLTSFSILMARYKGFLSAAVDGVCAVDKLEDGDKVLISEGCTHHRQCDDIGTVKLPRWLKEYTGKDLNFEFSSGTGFPEDVTPYKMVIHCGGCMLNEREMRYRMKCSLDQGVPFTNYGVLIAYLKGILKRSLKILPEQCKKL